MDNWNGSGSQKAHVSTICQFVEDCSGLEVEQHSSGGFAIMQKSDGKVLSVQAESIDEVITRLDSEGQNFLQVNFIDGQKILLTEKLVGFKPAQCTGLDMKKLPKVVTTPDLVSVIEAIEESMSNEGTHPIEIDVLRKVFDAVLEGGEAVGFNLKSERAWLKWLQPGNSKASA